MGTDQHGAHHDSVNRRIPAACGDHEALFGHCVIQAHGEPVLAGRDITREREAVVVGDLLLGLPR